MRLSWRQLALCGSNASRLLVNILLLGRLSGICRGGLTFTRASVQWGQDDSGGMVQVGNGVPFFNSKGVLCEPASTNKCTCYGTVPADTLGAEKVSDVGFDNPALWTAQPGWTVTGSEAVCNGSTAKQINLTSAPSMSAGKVYELTIVISAYTAGSLFFYDGSGGNLTGNVSGVGTFTRRLVCGSNSLYLYSHPTTGFNGKVASFSAKEVQFAVGTKSYYGGAWYQNHTNITLASTDTANPPTLTTVDGTADLTAAGLLSISQSGKWYQASNPAGAGATAQVKITGSTVNTNNHSYFVIGKQTGGAFLSTQSDGADGIHNVILPAAVGKAAKENVTIPSSTGIYIGLPPGANAWFFLPQLEELSACTSPMPPQGAAATRAASIPSFQRAGNTKSNDFTVYLEVTPYSITPATQSIFSTGATAGSGFLVTCSAGTSLGGNKYIAGSAKNSALTQAVVANVTKKIAFRVSPVSGVAIFASGAKGATVSADAADIAYSAASVTIGSYQAGATTNPFFGYVRKVRVYKTALTDAQCIALTT